MVKHGNVNVVYDHENFTTSSKVWRWEIWGSNANKLQWNPFPFVPRLVIQYWMKN